MEENDEPQLPPPSPNLIQLYNQINDVTWRTYRQNQCKRTRNHLALLLNLHAWFLFISFQTLNFYLLLRSKMSVFTIRRPIWKVVRKVLVFNLGKDIKKYLRDEINIIEIEEHVKRRSVIYVKGRKKITKSRTPGLEIVVFFPSIWMQTFAVMSRSL